MALTVAEFLEKWCGEYSFKESEKFKPLMKADLEEMLRAAASKEGERILTSCNICNSFKSSKIFKNVEEIKIYVAQKWEKLSEEKV